MTYFNDLTIASHYFITLIIHQYDVIAFIDILNNVFFNPLFMIAK